MFRKYYLLTLSARFVPFSEIDHIDARKPTIASAKWRIGGTGSPGAIWFPLDWHRPSRDTIFRAALKNGKAIGFSVEDSARVIDVLKGLGLISTTIPDHRINYIQPDLQVLFRRRVLT